MTTALSTYSTPPPLHILKLEWNILFNALNYCLQHSAAVWFVNRPFAASHSPDTKPPSRRTKVAKWTRQQKIYIIWNGIFFVYLVPVPLLLSSTTDLYHVNDWLQRAYYCWQWLLKWYVVTELLDVAYSFVSFFFYIFRSHIRWTEFHYVSLLNSWCGYWTIFLH